MSTIAEALPGDARTNAGAIRFALPAAGAAQARLARAWLWLGLLALIGAGTFAILLVVSRTPQLQTLLPLTDFFHVALVVHVDLSVLVWFVSTAGLLWTLAGGTRALSMGWAALATCALGTALMAAAPFAGGGAAIMSNYIPLLDDRLFIGGLIVFGAGCTLLVVRSALAILPELGSLDGAGALRRGLALSMLPAAVALIAFAWSHFATPGHLAGKAYYEILFWGGGHALQFAWTAIMLIAWMWLAGACGARIALSPRLAVALFALAVVGAPLVLAAYLLWPVYAVAYRHFITFAMGIGCGLPILPVALAVAIALPPGRPLADDARPLRAALYASLVLFAVGGAFAFTISGSNVKIPAHYHGCIVGVTLALMGLVYHLLPQLGYARPARRLAASSAYCYGLGQLLHISGLVWSGGYGVPRKVGGSEQILHGTKEIVGMGIMGTGGLIAIIGGLLFVVTVILSIGNGHKQKTR